MRIIHAFLGQKMQLQNEFHYTKPLQKEMDHHLDLDKSRLQLR